MSKDPAQVAPGEQSHVTSEDKPSGSKFLPKNPFSRWSVVTIPLLLMSFYCFYGHSQGKLFALPMLLMSLAVMLFSLGYLARLVQTRSQDALGELAGWQKGVIVFGALVQTVLLVCVSVHYANYPKTTK